LKHHAGVPLVRGEPGHVLVAEKDLPLFRDVETGEAAQQRRLAAAARPQQEEKLALLDREIELVQGNRGAKFFSELFYPDGNHRADVDRREETFRPASKSK
jgi:hypothetical protein